jgi:hypothetical protein
MSDAKSSYGDPVEEPRPADDDVVTRANQGLAEAEAARAQAVPADQTPSDRSAADRPVSDDSASDHTASDDAAVDRSLDDRSAADRASGEAPSSTPAAVPATDRDTADRAYAPPSEAATAQWDASDFRDDDERDRFAAYEASASSGAAAPATSSPAAAPAAVPVSAASPSSAPRVTPSEPVPDRGYDAPTVVAAPLPQATAPAPQPIFVQAPEAPRPRGNRAAAGAIGLLAALAFAVLYLAAWLGFGALAGDVTLDTLATSALEALTTWALWIPVLVFFLAFWLLGAIINRGRWGSWVIFGLLVGFAAWAGHVLGQLFQAPFWTLTAREGAALTAEQLFAPLAIVAFILGRELTIWFGAWVAARGRRVTELNDEAQREYERTLEAGPQLVRQ